MSIVDHRMVRLCKRKRLVCCVRYMDYIVLLARTSWELRRTIVALHEEIAALGLRLHRVKRFIGRNTHGFYFSATGPVRGRDGHRLRQYVLPLVALALRRPRALERRREMDLVLRHKSQDRLRRRPAHERPVRPKPIRRAVEGSGTGLDHTAYVKFVLVARSNVTTTSFVRISSLSGVRRE